MKPEIKIKRAYEDVSEDDGYRVLVDRLWPRGLSKASLKLDEWNKNLAPSTALRTWYGHKPERWRAFQEKYRDELKENDAVKEFLRAHKHRLLITLIYAAKDKERTHALVLQHFLEKNFGS
jgi:uncharacterized protein YeaO (DUF488 family)